MCGITGLLNARADATRGALTATIEAMAARMAHRGPDQAGSYVDEAAGLALGFRRLAILDLTPTGHQPMRSRSGRYTIVFNGEIYNYLELAEELRANGAAFRGHSDTEMILEAVEQWGLEATVTRLYGMFAIALWDADTRELALLRDRMGEKPLYYGTFGGSFVFASELKVLRAHPDFAGELDRAAIAPFLAYGYVPAPRSVYRGVKKLLPGHALRVAWRDGRLVEHATPYWAVPPANGIAAPAGPAADAAAVEELDALLRTVVRQQMLADVPLGAFLSGGIDSSTVVAVMQALSPRPVKTFTIGFDVPQYSEATHARAVADHLGVDHTELTVTANDALATIPALPHIFDEPFADPSQIPTLLVSRLARQHVTVSLSGDGGDELFAGYERYQRALARWQRVGRLPGSLRAGAGKAVGLLPRANTPTLAKAAKLGALLERSADPDDFYRSFVTVDPDAHLALGPAVRALAPDARPHAGPATADVLRRFMRLDMAGYLPDDILVKVDRASMAVSLESRAPFLDPRVVEFAAGLPTDQLLRDGQGKWILRRVLDRYVPRTLVDRPKMGFGVPLGEWMVGPLRGWADDLLAPDTLRSQGLLDPVYVTRIWTDQKSGRGHRQYQLWNILMLQAWLQSVAADTAPACPAHAA